MYVLRQRAPKRRLAGLRRQDIGLLQLILGPEAADGGDEVRLAVVERPRVVPPSWQVQLLDLLILPESPPIKKVVLPNPTA